MKTWKPLIFIAAVVLSVVSIALPVTHWVNIATDTSIKWLAGLTIFSLALCKLAFFPLAWSNFMSRRFTPAITLFAFAVFLLIISVDATRNLFEEQTMKRETKLVTQTYDYKQLKTEIEQLNQQIETQSILQAKDVENHFRERAIQQAAKLETLKKQREEKRGELSDASQAHSSSARLDFGVSLGLGDGRDSGLLSAFTDGPLITAFGIHVGCVIAVLACGVWFPRNATEEQKIECETLDGTDTIRHKEVVTDKPESLKVQEDAKITLDEDQRLFAERIICGDYPEENETLGVKKVILSGEVVGGHRRVKPIFDWLLQNNHIKKEGRHFHLVQSVIV